jgi:hypothetical protein
MFSSPPGSKTEEGKQWPGHSVPILLNTVQPRPMRRYRIVAVPIVLHASHLIARALCDKMHTDMRNSC